MVSLRLAAILIAATQLQICPLIQFNFMSMFIQVPFRSSEAIEAMYVNPISGVVELAYNKGNVYRYEGVSRRAIINLLMNKNMSLGFWVNNNLLGYDADVQCYSLPVYNVAELPTFA